MKMLPRCPLAVYEHERPLLETISFKPSTLNDSNYDLLKVRVARFKIKKNRQIFAKLVEKSPKLANVHRILVFTKIPPLFY